MRDWISVEDRLPPLHDQRSSKPVLTAGNDGRPFVRRWWKNTGFDYDAGTWSTITHWMPIPDLPAQPVGTAKAPESVLRIIDWWENRRAASPSTAGKSE
jgi:hypothetical protein